MVSSEGLELMGGREARLAMWVYWVRLLGSGRAHGEFRCGEDVVYKDWKILDLGYELNPAHSAGNIRGDKSDATNLVCTLCCQDKPITKY